MDRNELIQIFDIESLDDFADFEQFAVLVEDIDNVDEDMFYEVLDGVRTEVLAELVECYFEDIKLGVPDDEMNLYTALSCTSINFQNRLRQVEAHTEKMMFADELYRFRQWYMEIGSVLCVDMATNATEEISVCEALVRCRVEKLSEGKFTYDFSACETFSTEEYLDEQNEQEDEEDDIDDAYSEGLISRDHPVIDGEEYHERDDEENEEDYE